MLSPDPTRIPLPRDFFDRPVLEVAPDLLGRTLACSLPEGTVELRLTEVEAYDGPNDPGSHAFRGRTPRNEVMFGEPGHVYVYFTYGMHYCMNLVCGPVGSPSGVLLRAGEIITGLPLARKRRSAARRDSELAQGPARATLALGVDRTLDGADACAESESDSPFRVLTGSPPLPGMILSGPRTGVSGDGAPIPWRFWIEGDPTVSRYRAHVSRRRAARRAAGPVR